MPKKRQDKTLLIKPGSNVRPASLDTNPRKDDGASRSVNQLLIESRRAQGHHELPQTPTTISSIHPSVRAVLNLPPPTQPVPRRRVGGPAQLRRIPGPPPPRSWLTDSVHTPKSLQQAYGGEDFRTRLQSPNSTLPGITFPTPTSLQHVVMKSIAVNWDWHVEFDNEWLASLPVHLKEVLLSHIGIFNEKPAVNPLRMLFMIENDRDDCDEIKRLDLCGGIGMWTNMKALHKDMLKKSKDITAGIPHSEVTRESKHVDSAGVVPDSWDEPLKQSLPPNSGALLRCARFQNLLHLSFALVPGSQSAPPTWPSLLSLTADVLPRLQSLSLAYWPLPTLTPLASRTRVKVQLPGTSTIPQPVYGGTDMYSHSLDNNWREASGILRSLSRNLFNLLWLDLTGCGEWWKALTWADTAVLADGDADAMGPDWNGAWRGIETIILRVGWSPVPPVLLDHQPMSDSHHVGQQSLPERTSDAYIPPSRRTELGQNETLGARLQSLRINSASSAALVTDETIANTTRETWNADVERQKYYYRKEVERHKGLQQVATLVGEELRSIRRRRGGTWISVDSSEIV